MDSLSHTDRLFPGHRKHCFPRRCPLILRSHPWLIYHSAKRKADYSEIDSLLGEYPRVPGVNADICTTNILLSTIELESLHEISCTGEGGRATYAFKWRPNKFMEIEG
jgi:hypothetical protein